MSALEGHRPSAHQVAQPQSDGLSLRKTSFCQRKVCSNRGRMRLMRNRTVIQIAASTLIASAALTTMPVTHSAARFELVRRSPSSVAIVYDVRVFGAKGDGKTVDTPAINRAIEAAAAAGGGSVYLPAGAYLCFSIRLQSNIALYLDQGATILAADPA